MTKPKVNFGALLEEFGGIRVLLNKDFVSAIVITFLVWFLWVYSDVVTLNKEVFAILIGTSSALFGLLFTAFSIFISVSDQKFISILRKTKLLNKLVFPFWYVSILYLTSIILDFFVIITIKPYTSSVCSCEPKCGCNPIPPINWIAIIAIFFTLYSFFATFYRIASTVKIGIYRSFDYNNPEENKK